MSAVTIDFEQLTREQLKNRAKDGYAAVIPLGAIEQHGPHLPTGTDTFVCGEISRRSVQNAMDKGTKLVLGPVLPIGCSSHHLAFGGTLSFASNTYLSILKDIGNSLIESGFQRIIFLNAHGGNEHLMHQAATDLAVQHKVWTASASYWSIAREALEAAGAAEMGPFPGHAGGFEASLVMALEHRIDRSRMGKHHPERDWIKGLVPGTFIGRHMELTGVDGFTDSAAAAAAAHGRRYMEAIVQAVSAWLADVCSRMDEADSGK
ncbi:creatinine amidohydrolase [Paenibacillus montaniterrae]|uniref:Creatinine amidohydrolase n=1 Tax=Paenibacillus montaniterrae TaxID=429341 RepID=A0A919YP49_9BACL|nr:creatininase family protein [Paenibacillus montaniterrae]GIP17473.1 creatinine amidohydrolase [Paenibacillus montaniterrae]